MGSLIAPSSFLNQKCADFNGTNEYMIRTGGPSWAGDNTGAISFWFTPDVVFGSDATRFIISLGYAGSGLFYLGIRRNFITGSSTYFSWVGVDAAGTINAAHSATTTPLVAGTRYHVLFQSDGSVWTCWINGVSQTITKWGGGGLLTNNGNWYGDCTGTSPVMTIGVGYSAGAIGSTFFDGKLDEVSYVTGAALSSGQVAETYNGGTPSNPHRWTFSSRLRMWLRMGDSRDSATTVFDEINSNDFPLVNMDASNYVAV